MHHIEGIELEVRLTLNLNDSTSSKVLSKSILFIQSFPR